jgi:hypothetical protein
MKAKKAGFTLIELPVVVSQRIANRVKIGNVIGV